MVRTIPPRARRCRDRSSGADVSAVDQACVGVAGEAELTAVFRALADHRGIVAVPTSRSDGHRPRCQALASGLLRPCRFQVFTASSLSYAQLLVHSTPAVWTAGLPVVGVIAIGLYISAMLGQRLGTEEAKSLIEALHDAIS